MSDATTVLLALGPAAITGVVGYVAARAQSRAAIRSAEIENERLRLDHREAERQGRKETYHQLLTLLHRLDAMMAGFADLSQESFSRWLSDFESASGAVDLFGGIQVRRELRGVRERIDEIGLRARRRDGRTSFETLFAEAYRDGRAPLTAAVDRTLEAMRSDVALSEADHPNRPAA